MSGRRSLHDLNGNGVPDNLEKKHGHSDLNRNGIDDKYERKGDQLETRRAKSNDLNANGIPDQFERMNLGTTYRSEVFLPTKIIEKPAAIHEQVRREQVEEIQPVVNVEKYKTEVHQITQPLVDREVRAVGVMEKTLPSQILPQINQPNVAMRSSEDFSTVTYRDKSNMVIEKPALYMETEKRQIIEEIQPVIYKETIVPTLIKETKPIYQTIVEGTTYVHEVMPAQQLKTSAWSGRSWGTSDLNRNGIPDQFETGTNFRSNDFNRNGIPDQFEGVSNWKSSNDLNGNGVPDQLERGTNFRSNDLNRNGIPDQLERGSNFQSNDLNKNGIPDQLERGTKVAPSASPNSPFASVRTL